MQTVTTEMVDGASSFHIRGRFLSYQAFTRGLHHLAEALGVAPTPVLCCDDPEGIVAVTKSAGSLEEDMVVVASARIPYNPRWGGYGGIPNLRCNGSGQESKETIADFLAPFLRSYHSMQENIHLCCSPNGHPLVIIPAALLKQGLPCGSYRLRIVPAALVEGDGQEISPHWYSYRAGEQLRRRLVASRKDLRAESHVPIGQYLGKEAITFEAIDEDASSGVGYGASLFPHLSEIVSDATPNMRAAEYHLRHRFAIDTARLSGQRHQGKILYVSALDIDMTAMSGGEGRLIVPWRAYFAPGGGSCAEPVILTQDELFLRLRCQDQCCPA